MDSKPQSGAVDASNITALLSDLLLDAQVMQIEFRHDTGIIGGIWIRGDQLIAAKIGDVRGAEAIEALLTQPDLRAYTAYRLNAKDTLGIEPIGSLSQILDDLTFPAVPRRRLVEPSQAGENQALEESKKALSPSQSLEEVLQLPPEVLEAQAQATETAGKAEVVETREIEVIEDQRSEVVEAREVEIIAEAPEVVETQEPEAIAQTREPEVIAEAPEVVEIQEPETQEPRAIETPEVEIVAETREVEIIAEATEVEIVETQESETREVEIVAGTSEVVEAREVEIVAETREPEAIVEPEAPQAVAETREPAPQPQQAKVNPAPQKNTQKQGKSKEKAQRILAVVSPKGGVGKTTISLNLAVMYAQQGLSVILIDTDPQGGISNSLISSDDAPAGIYDVLMGRIPFRQAIKNTRFENLRLITAGVLLPEEVITRSGQLSSPELWQKVLSPIGKIADVVIVDTPAGVQGVTTPILTAATHAIAVSQPEPLSLRALGQLKKTMSSLEKLGKVAELSGVVINMAFAERLVPLNILQTTSKGVINPQTLLEPMLVRNDAVFKASISATPVALSTQANQQIWVSALHELSDSILQRIGLQAVDTNVIESLLV